MSPARRKRPDDLDTSPDAVLGDVAGHAGERRWVAVVMAPLLAEDMAGFQVALDAAAEPAGTTSRQQLLDATADGLLERGWALSSALWKRGHAPVFLTGAARLLDGAIDPAFGESVSNLMRRPRPATASQLWQAASALAVRPFEALATLAYYVDAGCDDVASLCGATRDQVLRTVWGTADIDGR